MNNETIAPSLLSPHKKTKGKLGKKKTVEFKIKTQKSTKLGNHKDFFPPKKNDAGVGLDGSISAKLGADFTEREIGATAADDADDAAVKSP